MGRGHRSVPSGCLGGCCTTGDTDPDFDGDNDIDAAPGNMALWDILFGVKFVHDHIASFGGDVNQVDARW